MAGTVSRAGRRRLGGTAAAAEVRPRRPRCPAPTGDGSALEVFGCFHVSQQNTFTGRLTQAMVEAVLSDAGLAAGLLPR
ncbi:uracil-DNA glycosylase domain protein [Rhodococcus sp. MTM3W5.2]|nr:uracil-DNA glycosylase domain protein [Rhodococcus sp. MTM3W5.2]